MGTLSRLAELTCLFPVTELLWLKHGDRGAKNDVCPSPTHRHPVYLTDEWSELRSSQPQLVFGDGGSDLSARLAFSLLFLKSLERVRIDVQSVCVCVCVCVPLCFSLCLLVCLPLTDWFTVVMVIHGQHPAGQSLIGYSPNPTLNP